MINENYFELVDPDHSVVWSYAVSGSSGTPVYYSLNLNQPVIRDDFTFEVEQVMSDDETAVIGNYQLVVEPHQSAQVTLTLKYEIDHKYGKDDNNEMITEPLYLVYNMALMNHAVMPTSLEYLLEFRGTTQTILSNEGFHFEQGVHTKLTPIIKNGTETLNNSDYIWYAFNLPAGLASTSEGNIAGVPTTVSTTTQAKILIQDKYNNSKVFTISHYVYAHMGSYNLALFRKSRGLPVG